MKKVLIVAYYYPPVGGSGVLRTLKLTKYLPQFGFAPFVLTVRNRSVGMLDPTLLEDVPQEVKVTATLSAEHRFLRAPRLLGVNPKWFLVPDVHIGWLPFALRYGEGIIRKEGIDIIFATTPVLTSLLVGYLLKKRTGRPLVLDFRDPWTQDAFATFPTRLHQKLEEKMESLVLQSADHVVATTKEMTQGLIAKYPFMRGRCETITNGFDSSDFCGLNRSASPDRFTITYAGSLYGLRSARHFLAALRNLVRKNRELHNNVRVVFVGRKDKEALRLVQKLQLKDVVEMTGFVAHRESLQLMMNADVLLLVMGQGEAVGNGSRTVMIPGKIFEYLAARRPILALAPPGEVSDLIRETGSGMVVPPEGIEAIEDAILKSFDRWRAGALNVAPCDVSAYERKALTAKFVRVFESLCLGERRSIN